VIVSQKGRIKEENNTFKADKESTITKKPLSILINGGSASASEIVSGSLQDHKRAVLVGEKTFGKGSVQVILPIDKDEALKLTIARYYLPSGRTIQAKGVTPDVLIHSGKVPLTDDDKFSIKEQDLKKHLESELAKTTNNNSKESISKENNESKKLITKKMINNDIQLKMAIDAIKIQNILKGK
jgi:carboxyl-terminal processing protease